MTDLAQVYGIDVPRNRCEVCGHLFVTPGDETVCSDCWNDEFRPLREWVNPENGGTMPRDMRNLIIKLLDEHDQAVVVKVDELPAPEEK